jgi:ParB-like chromosome segregation protein Spo0J
MTSKRSETKAVENETAAEWVPINIIHPWKDNPRKNDGTPVAKVAASIKRFGFAAPIIVRKADGEIIAGHTRYKAAKKLGLARVPVRFLDLDPADAHLLAIADNRVGEEASWDDDLLPAVLAELRAQNMDLGDTGMDDKEIDKILASTEIDEAADDESGELLDMFKVVVSCKDERDQAILIEKLQADGYDVRALVG